MKKSEIQFLVFYNHLNTYIGGILMKIKRKYLILLSSTFLIAGCTDNAVENKSKVAISKVNHSSQKSNPTQANIMSYQKFENLFKHMNDKLKIKNFQLKESTLGPDVTIIDKELSFNKRNWLTINGTKDDLAPKSTQETLYFEDKDQTTLLSISFAYTKNYVGEDMLQYQVPSGYDNINQKLANKSDLILLSYKNIVISIQQNNSDKVNYDTTKFATKMVINELKTIN